MQVIKELFYYVDKMQMSNNKWLNFEQFQR